MKRRYLRYTYVALCVGLTTSLLTTGLIPEQPQHGMV
jgi:hypothetical protein